jgi:3-phenylpropionate/cinnamic acid dioxygenase small subunit
VSEIEDNMAIVDLIHRYAEAVDERRPDRVAGLFAEECEFQAFDGDRGTARSPREVEVLAQRLLSTFTRTSHHVSNTRLVFEGPDRARGLTYLLAWHAFPEDRQDGILWGRYHDIVERRGGTWLFVQRTLRVTSEQNFAFKWLPPEAGWLG